MTAKISACQKLNQKISQDDLKLIRTSGHPQPPAFWIICNFCTMDDPHMWQQTFVTLAHRTVTWPHHDLLSRSSKFQVSYSFQITFRVSAEHQKSSFSSYCCGLHARLLHRLPARAQRRTQAAWLHLSAKRQLPIIQNTCCISVTLFSVSRYLGGWSSPTAFRGIRGYH